MKDVRTSGNDGRHIDGAPSNKVDMCEAMTQSPRTSDNAGRFTAEEYGSVRQLKRTGVAAAVLRAPSSKIIDEALRLAARVSAEPDEKMVEAMTKRECELWPKTPNGCAALCMSRLGSIPKEGCAYRLTVHGNRCRAVIAAYRDAVLRGE